MGKGGKGKGMRKQGFKGGAREVIKPFVKVSSFKSAARAQPQPQKGKSGGKGQWVFVPSATSSQENGRSIAKKGNGKITRRHENGNSNVKKGKGKGKVTRSHDNGNDNAKKGKGKGKGKRSAPLASKFWEKKEENENRQVLGEKTYTGTINRYNVKFGYGFVIPNSAMPLKVKNKLSEAAQAAMQAGKDVDDPNKLYFRKPDVNHEEGFKLAEGVTVTFKLYIDDKGAGACDVSQA